MPIWGLICFFFNYLFIICSEDQLKKQLEQDIPLNESSGVIENNTGQLELQDSRDGQILTCNLSKMKATKIHRKEKKRSERVVDEKFVLLFQTKFAIEGREFSTWTVSTPIVYIVNVNQGTKAEVF